MVKATRVVPKVSKREQYQYAMKLLELVNVAAQIRAGRAEELAESIESSLPDYLNQMVKFGFKDTPVMRAGFLMTKLLFRAAGKSVPKSLARYMKAYAKPEGVVSDDCYDLTRRCGGILCFKDVTSLQPVDLKKKNPWGWRYIQGTACGYDFFRRKPCGTPLNGPLCTEVPD